VHAHVTRTRTQYAQPAGYRGEYFPHGPSPLALPSPGALSLALSLRVRPLPYLILTLIATQEGKEATGTLGSILAASAACAVPGFFLYVFVTAKLLLDMRNDEKLRLVR
jgi:hypothetical protein